MNIKVEIRSFISEEKYRELIEFFTRKGSFIGEDYQETFYFEGEHDLRIQRTNNGAKIWLKKGQFHDDTRDEVEINFSREDFEKLEKLFRILGYEVALKWFRKRHTFTWQGISVLLDYAKGYGYILELGKMANEEEQEDAIRELRYKLATLKIPVTPREEFNKKFEQYKQHWRELVK